MADLITQPNLIFLDDNADPLVGGLVFFYDTGALTPKTTYTDSAGLVAHSNPIVLDGNGRTPQPVYGLGSYRVIVQDFLGNQISDTDNVPTIASVASVNSQWIDGWTAPSFASSTTYTRAGDTRLDDHPGRRIRAHITGGAVIYGEIVSVAFSANTTVTVRLDSGALDAGLTAVDLALITVTGSSLPIAAIKPSVITVANVTYLLEPTESGVIAFVTGASGKVTLPDATLAGKGFSSLVYNDEDPATGVDIVVDLDTAGDTMNGTVGGSSLLRPGDTMKYFVTDDATGYRNNKFLAAAEQHFLAGQQIGTIASATTLALKNETITTVSGTASVTSITSTHNLVWVLFSGAVTLVHNNDDIIGLGGASIVAAAGDSCLLYQYAMGKFRVLNWQNVSGRARVPKIYTSAELTISAAGSETLAHGLGARPSLIYAFIRCDSTEGGYADGDEVALGTWSFDTASSSLESGASVRANATNILVRYRNLTAWDIPHATTGEAFAITFANWRFLVRAWQ